MADDDIVPVRAQVEETLAAASPDMPRGMIRRFIHGNHADDGFYGRALEPHLIIENLYNDRHRRFEWSAQYAAKLRLAGRALTSSHSRAKRDLTAATYCPVLRTSTHKRWGSHKRTERRLPIAYR